MAQLLVPGAFQFPSLESQAAAFKAALSRQFFDQASSVAVDVSRDAGMVLFLDLLGLMGSLLVAASLVPQIVKVYRTKSARDLSRSFQFLYVIGLLLVAIYGFGMGLWPVYIPVTLELAGGLLLLGMKLYYDRLEATTIAHASLEAPVSPPVSKRLSCSDAAMSPASWEYTSVATPRPSWHANMSAAC